MSRVIFKLIDSVLGTDKKQYIIFHNNNVQDLDIVKNIGGDFLSFEKNNKDTLDIIKLISDTELSNNLTILPTYIICTNFMKYEAARNLSNIIKTPLINIISSSIDNLKKETLFNISNILNQDINIIFDEKIAKLLYLTNYFIIKDITEIKEIIEREYKKWKPV